MSIHVNRALVEDKMRGFKGGCAHFSFNKCPIDTHDGASAKFGINSQETGNSVQIDYLYGTGKYEELKTLYSEFRVQGCYGIRSLGSVQCLRFRFQHDSRFRVKSSGFRVQSSEFRVQSSEFRVQSSEFRVQSSGFRVQSSEFRVQGHCQVPGQRV